MKPKVGDFVEMRIGEYFGQTYFGQIVENDTQDIDDDLNLQVLTFNDWKVYSFFSKEVVRILDKDEACLHILANL